jgi:quaternary ammonium compound-resistance protein SugE
VALSVSGRTVGNRLGDRAEIHGSFTRLFPSLLTAAAMVLSLALLGLALKTLPVGTAYAVWTGVGAVGTAALGIYLFSEPATALRLACIGLIVLGIAGLKFAS